MSNYKQVPTSPEVWAVIRARHHSEMCVFGSYSNPTGDDGITCQPQVYTEYGFKDSEYPFMGARTTWESHPVNEWERVNEKHEYWICLPKDND